jgi:hypothetical protein
MNEYTYARTALEAARDQDAARFAPSYWHQAEEAYRAGEALYKQSDYVKAEEQFIVARELAEKAENATRVQKFKSGEISQ